MNGNFLLTKTEAKEGCQTKYTCLFSMQSHKLTYYQKCNWISLIYACQAQNKSDTYTQKVVSTFITTYLHSICYFGWDKAQIIHG